MKNLLRPLIEYKHVQYAWYVIRHKWFVFLACLWTAWEIAFPGKPQTLSSTGFAYEDGDTLSLDHPNGGRELFRITSVESATVLNVIPVLSGKWLALRLVWRGITHDLSKLRPSEWFPYVESFYGGYAKDERPPELEDSYDEAWLHHQHRNPHHWQYWLLREDNPEHGGIKMLHIPALDLLEMLCDWYGAGWAIQGEHGWDKVLTWWLAQDKDQVINLTTKAQIRAFLQERAR